MIRRRRIEARQSVLVQVNSEKSFAELHTYCSKYGQIVGSHHYTQDELHYILLEYANSDEADAAINSSTFNEDASVIVVQSPFIWFRAGFQGKATKKEPFFDTAASLTIENGNRVCTDNEINAQMQLAESISDQMILLHRLTCLNDIGTRLRFLAARQIEQSLVGMFPSAQACPFGSSVNGFGRLGCDLDLILRLSAEIKKVSSNSLYTVIKRVNTSICRKIRRHVWYTIPKKI